MGNYSAAPPSNLPPTLTDGDVIIYCDLAKLKEVAEKAILVLDWSYEPRSGPREFRFRFLGTDSLKDHPEIYNVSSQTWNEFRTYEYSRGVVVLSALELPLTGKVVNCTSARKEDKEKAMQLRKKLAEREEVIDVNSEDPGRSVKVAELFNKYHK